MRRPTRRRRATPRRCVDVSGALGRGGYEGIQNDEDGNLWIVEDIGGANKPATTAKIPNSFVYRYVPATPGDLAHGKLQVLQVLNASHTPITKASQTPVMSADQVALHTYGQSFDTPLGDDPRHGGGRQRFVQREHGRRGGERHAVQAARERACSARTASFTQFFFDETGDTNSAPTAVENGCCGGWTGVFKLTQSDPSAATGKLTLFYKGDMAHAGFDNVAFFSRT